MSNVRNSNKGVVKPLGIDISDWEGEFKPDGNAEIDFVSIRCLKPMIVRITGKVTGRQYVFKGAGSILDDVDKRDVEGILSRNKKVQSCCGSFSGPYFEIV